MVCPPVEQQVAFGHRRKPDLGISSGGHGPVSGGRSNYLGIFDRLFKAAASSPRRPEASKYERNLNAAFA
ncbi:hypothetical protein [Chelativorans sp.]|uniref:hypothetical protein n=1 Tax=Chelativorans sp. TaxID=2203393 RepID=UPI002811FAFF|nr:hypothetical protein [Chelativorans sp.]